MRPGDQRDNSSPTKIWPSFFGGFAILALAGAQAYVGEILLYGNALSKVDHPVIFRNIMIFTVSLGGLMLVGGIWLSIKRALLGRRKSK